MSNYKIINGDMLKELDKMEENSIDSIVTDPPYELNFMNRGWDNAGISFQKETWEKCLRVLKPGGYLLAFGGSRTFHRIACAIEDAGFEIRDTIMWMYGCYSADTQVLTDKGWKYFYNLDKTEKVLQWDANKDILSWVKPLNYFEYDIDDELMLIRNVYTSQLITKNHSVFIKDGKEFDGFIPYRKIEAKEMNISQKYILPLASKFNGNIDCNYAKLLGWWVINSGLNQKGKCVFSFQKQKKIKKIREELDRLKALNLCNYREEIDESNIERPRYTFYVTGEAADYLLKNYGNRKLNWNTLNFNEKCKKELIEGLMGSSGSVKKGNQSKMLWSRSEQHNDIVSALLTTIGYRNHIVYTNNGQQGVAYNTNTLGEVSYQHKKLLERYVGKVYCLETETGAFVVRRCGKPFISGNSGFPKSLNIGLAIDKKNGIESPIVGTEKSGSTSRAYQSEEMTTSGEYSVREAQNKWKGWGTQLKPSYEPILVARKPTNLTIVDNVEKFGVGGINIDECRVEAEERTIPVHSSDKKEDNTLFGLHPTIQHERIPTTQGRFPANTILTYNENDFEEVCGGFPDSKGASSQNNYSNGSIYRGQSLQESETKLVGHRDWYNDDGSAARYFKNCRYTDKDEEIKRYIYTPKASKKDRDEGLEGLNVIKGDNNIKEQDSLYEEEVSQNIHPTVKPTELMQYLVRLVSPIGATILDPFMGSGSTGKAVMYENNSRDADYKFIGIEQSEEYCDIANRRIAFAEGDRIVKSCDEDGNIIVTKQHIEKQKRLF